jgi:hypothetical protein
MLDDRDRLNDQDPPMPSISFHGKEHPPSETPPEIGQNMAAFTLIGGRARDPNLLDRNEVASWRKPVLFSVVTSVDTPVGSLEAKVFEKRLSDAPLADRVAAILVTSDLPFTINRFCRAEDIDHQPVAQPLPKRLSQISRHGTRRGTYASEGSAVLDAIPRKLRYTDRRNSDSTP